MEAYFRIEQLQRQVHQLQCVKTQHRSSMFLNLSGLSMVVLVCFVLYRRCRFQSTTPVEENHVVGRYHYLGPTKATNQTH